MALSEDLAKDVAELIKTTWVEREGKQIPEPEDVKLGNDAVTLDGTVLYADLADSTDLVQGYKVWFAAEIYKAYLHCASKIIRDEGGIVTAFDGDRVMAVFIGDSRNTSAARSALKINHAVVRIINRALAAEYPKNPYKVQHAVGVDSSSLFIARTGIRGSNDLVWVGRAANYAAKMCSLREGVFASWITDTVYNALNAEAKTTNGQAMWEQRTWTARNINVYRSNWMWAP
jgi:class 3 adenylate cyclase